MDLSWSSVLKTNARVRRFGRSDSVTAAAASAARVAVRVLEAREALLERRGLVLVRERHLERRGLLGEEALEGGAAGDVRLGEHALLGLRELVRAVTAQRPQVVRVEVEPVAAEQLLRPLVGHEVPLEVEEEEMGLDRGAQLARLLHERAAPGVGGVERVAEHRVGAGRPARSWMAPSSSIASASADEPSSATLPL